MPDKIGGYSSKQIHTIDPRVNNQLGCEASQNANWDRCLQVEVVIVSAAPWTSAVFFESK